jgi:hypothetical protein
VSIDNFFANVGYNPSRNRSRTSLPKTLVSHCRTLSTKLPGPGFDALAKECDLTAKLRAGFGVVREFMKTLETQERWKRSYMKMFRSDIREKPDSARANSVR